MKEERGKKEERRKRERGRKKGERGKRKKERRKRKEKERRLVFIDPLGLLILKKEMTERDERKGRRK